jgi:hypothetical protein
MLAGRAQQTKGTKSCPQAWLQAQTMCAGSSCYNAGVPCVAAGKAACSLAIHRAALLLQPL